MLVALAEWHDQWQQQRLPGAEFDPDTNRAADYNMHYVDMVADDDEFHREARRIMGIDS